MYSRSYRIEEHNIVMECEIREYFIHLFDILPRLNAAFCGADDKGKQCMKSKRAQQASWCSQQHDI